MKKAVAHASRGPGLSAIPFLKTSPASEPIQLTDRQREQLASIAMRVRLPARMMIYREDAPAEWVFAVSEGAVKAYRELPSGKRAVSAFLFANDLFGLAENGRYLNSAQAITGVTLFRLPLVELAVLLKHDAELQFQFLAKVTHELREAQRRAILLDRRDAVGRLAMFVSSRGECPEGATIPEGDVLLPMARSDIAAFLGLSLETVSRASAELEKRGLVKFETRHRARILDPPRLAKLVAAV